MLKYGLYGKHYKEFLALICDMDGWLGQRFGWQYDGHWKSWRADVGRSWALDDEVS